MRIYVLSGPSGVGKTSSVNALLAKYPATLAYPLTYTTRAPRAGELHGRDMMFVSRAEWTSRLHQKEFLATNEIYNEFYGTLTKDVRDAIQKGLTVVMVLDAKGARDIRLSGLPACFIYLLPVSMDDVEKHLLKRWPNRGQLFEERLASARREVLDVWDYDFAIESHTIPQIVTALEGVMELCQTTNTFPPSPLPTPQR